MDFLDLTLPTLAENIALDEALLLACEEGSGQPVLRVWQWDRPAVVLGAAGVLADEVYQEACASDHVPIARRSSGGGTVLLGPGCLLYSLVMSYDQAPELTQIGASYRHILNRICTFLALPELHPAGTSDLALGDRKVSGNAQQRKRAHLLHHGSLLYSFDAGSAERYLRMPSRQPDYRQHRAHADFLTNLPLDKVELTARLCNAFEAATETADWPSEQVQKLVRSKYGLDEWTRRR